MTMIKLEEDRKFLIDQRSERNTIMTTLDKKLAGMQEKFSERQRASIQARKERASADDDVALSTSKILSAAAALSSPDKSSSNSEGEEEFVP
ncbi:hypothetical protein AVEN_96567-1 [Araneus ventricosus]|uniref:Uncharacterized protein n=1 Tax=Araneus ventricosus TaxID=182803 RepID=A0A4Y2H7B6_ARAVE|nr:hypothetical protein AVEN_96567-1 [Araneus ventricosus]